DRDCLSAGDDALAFPGNGDRHYPGPFVGGVAFREHRRLVAYALLGPYKEASNTGSSGLGRRGMRLEHVATRGLPACLYGRPRRPAAAAAGVAIGWGPI